MTTSLRRMFMLDPDISYLNHGSFGACPRPVFEAYQEFQRDLEARPVEFLGRRANELLSASREALGRYLNADNDDLVYVPNPTTAVNLVARSLELARGDEILATDHEYGAMDRTWRFITSQAGAHYRQVPLPLPLTDADAIVEQVWAQVTPRTRALFISHITSATGLRLPVEPLIRRARAAGLLTIVDGAHAPGQIPLDLKALDADLYTGACHKWLCAPKGAAFLYARKEVQPQLQPLIVSWGWEAETPSGSRFIDYHQWQGTRDIAPFLAVPVAIRFQQEWHWDQVREHCHQLAVSTRQRLESLTGLAPICPPNAPWLAQMAALRLPELPIEQLKVRLYDEFRIEIPIYRFHGQPMMRLSFQAYNDEEDADRIVSAMRLLLPLMSRQTA